LGLSWKSYNLIPLKITSDDEFRYELIVLEKQSPNSIRYRQGTYIDGWTEIGIRVEGDQLEVVWCALQYQQPLQQQVAPCTNAKPQLIIRTIIAVIK